MSGKPSLEGKNIGHIVNGEVSEWVQFAQHTTHMMSDSRSVPNDILTNSLHGQMNRCNYIFMNAATIHIPNIYSTIYIILHYRVQY